MPNANRLLDCPGCRRLTTTNPRLYCADCRKDLKKQACCLCDTPVATDVPWVLCERCEQAAEREVADALRRGHARDRSGRAKRA